MYSIGIEAAKHRYCVYFISFHELINQLKKAASENRLDARIKFFCRYKLLIIDKLGYQRMDTDSANLFFTYGPSYRLKDQMKYIMEMEKPRYGRNMILLK